MPTVMINGKKHTPSSGTLKKMKARAAAEAAAKKAKAKSGATAKMKAPIPATRSGKSGATTNMKPPIPAEMSDNLRNKRALQAAQNSKPAITGTK